MKAVLRARNVAFVWLAFKKGSLRTCDNEELLQTGQNSDEE